MINIIDRVRVTGNSDPNDWPMWLQIAWDKPQRTPGSVYPAAVNDDFWLNAMDSDGNVYDVKECDSLAWDGQQISILLELALN